MTAQFLFTVCQVGMENAVKAEMRRARPAWRMAFALPGFLTFKSDSTLSANVTLNNMFVRAYGLSLGAAADKPTVLEWAKAVARQQGPLYLHVFPRDSATPEQIGERDANRAAVAAWETSLRMNAPADVFALPQPPKPGDAVLDVVILRPDALWIGWHVHHLGHAPYAGGQFNAPLPVNAPSRAYLKLKEMQAWSGARMQPGQTAVEVGSSPGGACYALIEQGLHTVAIDPATMDSALPGWADAHGCQFKHIAKPIGAVTQADLPAHIDWLLLDMNCAPKAALNAVAPLLQHSISQFQGIVFTFKITKLNVIDTLPAIIKRLQGFGVKNIRTQQLFTHRREVGLFGEACAR